MFRKITYQLIRSTILIKYSTISIILRNFPVRQFYLEMLTNTLRCDKVEWLFLPNAQLDAQDARQIQKGNSQKEIKKQFIEINYYVNYSPSYILVSC